MKKRMKHLLNSPLIVRSKVLWTAVISSLSLIISMPAFADGGPSAKSFSSYILSDWVSPLFAIACVVGIIRFFMNQDIAKAVILFVAGGIIYFFIKDPSAFLDKLGFFATKFGF
ncbi:TcpD family membrane protein [Enterococcus sp. AZ196]|uniref:TcpD family membrane protein n=1 Tax=Enterococcus sp. AZ196 TaxID=2774659 RepID=UPI003D2B7C0C